MWNVLYFMYYWFLAHEAIKLSPAAIGIHSSTVPCNADAPFAEYAGQTDYMYQYEHFEIDTDTDIRLLK